MIDQLENYRAARNRYTEEDFSTFFEMTGTEAPGQQTIFMDALSAAGASYLQDHALRQERLTKGEILKELRRVQKASDELASSLKTLGQRSNTMTMLSEAVISRQEEFLTEYGADSGTYKILSSIFPFDVKENGFRQGGLQNSLRVLSEALISIQAEQIPKTPKGRLVALENWVSTLAMVWAAAKGKLPAIGHYDQGIGDYDSADVAALTFAIEKIDPQVSSRLVAEALKITITQFNQYPMQAMLHYGAMMMLLIRSGETYTHKENLKMFFQMGASGQGLSDADFDELWGSLQERSDEKTEEEYVSKEQFSEALNSSESGKMLLQGFVEATPK